MIGHIKIDRKILNWEWYTDLKVFHFFLYLLLKANHKDGTWKGVDIKRGQVLTGRLKASKETGLTEREIRTVKEKLIKTNEIAVKTTNKYTIITICKYDFYQSGSYSKDQQNDQQNVNQTTNRTPTNDQQTATNNNGNNNKEDKKVFNTMPLPENFNGLPEIKSGSVIELLRITKQVDLTHTDVKGLWEVFKVQNLTGKKYYGNEDEVYSHFINWSKNQKIQNNGSDKKSVDTTTKFNAGAISLLEKGKQQFAAIARNQDSGT